MAKMINVDTAGGLLKLRRFLEKHPKALVYDTSDSYLENDLKSRAVVSAGLIRDHRRVWCGGFVGPDIQ